MNAIRTGRDGDTDRSAAAAAVGLVWSLPAQAASSNAHDSAHAARAAGRITGRTGSPG
ncbi:hypothetical protein [Luteimonas salinilitoris]|uniref:Uncharacterized protein n=1 Tax=Luteimonas salinilitoris TaxID=3237697 RepID=A0ABV4HPU8_9GAMM